MNSGICQTGPTRGARAKAIPPPGWQEQEITTSDLASLLRALVEDTVNRTPEGRLYYTSHTVQAGDVPQRIEFTYPLFTVQIFNDGPSAIQIRVPDANSSDWSDLPPTESLPLSFPKGLIADLGYRIQSGLATIRVYGTY